MKMEEQNKENVMLDGLVKHMEIKKVWEAIRCTIKKRCIRNEVDQVIG
jgi:hypothetical protein